MSIEQTLEERGKRYGEFRTHAALSQALQKVCWGGAGYAEVTSWPEMGSVQQEALTMICHKIARILNGDPKYVDNWHDIAGYATLVEQTLLKAKE